MPKHIKTTKNIQKIEEIVRENRRPSIGLIAEIVFIDKETVQQILHDSLHMTKVCARLFQSL